MLKTNSLHTQTPLTSTITIDVDYKHEELSLTVTIQSLIPNNQGLVDRIERVVCREVNKINKLKK